MKLKQCLALLLAAAMLGGLPVLAAGTEAPAPEDIFSLGEPSEYGDIAIYDESAAEPVLFAARAYTAADESTEALYTNGAATSYDPRGDGFMTPVRTQGSWNTCWAVAAITAAEVDGLMNSMLFTGADATDLSERHLMYFFSHQADDPLGNSSQDYNVSPYFWLSNGGNPVIATMTMASWHGPADEAATDSDYSGLSYDDNLDGGYAYTDVLHLENTYALDISDASGREALKSMLREHGSAVLCMYYVSRYLFAGSPSAQKAAAETPDENETELIEPETDVTAPDDPGAENAAADTAEDAEDPAGDEASQDGEAPAAEPAGEAEEENASVEVETSADSDADAAEDDADTPAVPAEETDVGDIIGLDGAADSDETYSDSDAADFTVCYYQDGVRTTNHEVVVVGWDDEYPAENFGFSSAGAVPPGDGAWLCRNSQGSEWVGGDGYFWVSYYDASAAAATGGTISGRVMVFDFAPASNYDNNYEYDGATVLGYVNDKIDGRGVSTTDADSSTVRWYSNVFTACGNDEVRGTEKLKAVSTYTYRPGVSYTVQVYTDLKDASDPASGTLAAEKSGSFPYAGYHTVVLPKAVSLEEGDVFSVVFRIGAASDNTLFVPSCYTSSSWYSTNETLAGQSFVSMDGSSWTDCKTLNYEPNVRIKAFTDNVRAAFPYTDVPASAWYSEDVRAVWLKGIVEGISASTFEPDAEATRAQVVTMLWRLSGAPLSGGTTPFSDVSGGLWYSEAVAWASDIGLVEGYPDGSFRPSASVTRQELVALLYRYAGWSGLNTSGRAELTWYSDSAFVAVWSRNAVSWSLAVGLQKGVASASGICLAPGGYVTRAQLAAFMNRFSDMSV